MFKRLLILIGLIHFLYGVSNAEPSEDCDFYPVKKMKPLYYGQLLFDRLEYDDNKTLNYEMTSWYGGNYQRIWIEVEGENNFEKEEGDLERLDILYGKLFSPFWDIRAGVGYRSSYGDVTKDRKSFVVGLKGLAPYWFELDTNIRFTTEGELYGDFEAEYDLLFTQRLVLQPRIDTTFSFSDIPEIGVYNGINNINLSFRLRYELKREFAPYIGFSYNRFFEDSKKINDKDHDLTAFLGVRVWF